MNNKKIYFLLTGLLIASLFFNSCKKEKQTSIPTLFTTGVWQLGSIEETKYLGSTQLSDTTLVTDSTQILAFNADMTCSYQNFDDKAGTVSGTWSLSDTQLFLFANITYPEATSTGTKQPFINCHIINLGEYSLVMEAGDIQTYYSPTDNRTIRKYGFVRIKPTVTR
jgi:hypothetical protein